MTRSARIGVSLAAAALVLAASCAGRKKPRAESPRELPLQELSVPDGFRVTLFADRVPGARSLCLGDAGTVFVGSRRQGTVVALSDGDGDGRAEQARVVVEGMRQPNGVAFRDGALYVAEISQVWRLDDIEARLDDPPEPVAVGEPLPDEGHHGWRTIGFGPDGKLYVAVGAPCNVCEVEDPHGTILRMDADGGGREVYARGVRNSVGFDWHPDTGSLWFTDNGRDWLGDDAPPDELDRAPEPGLHFGFPHWHGRDHPDPEHGDGHEAGEFTPPVVELGAHVAALGMRFYTGEMFPPQYRGQILIAEHGSWNRSVPVGARVVLVRLDGEGEPSPPEVFAEGWQRASGTRWGRPVDLLVMPDGALLVSDDHAGAVYRITHEGAAAGEAVGGR